MERATFFLKICYNNNIFIREGKTFYINVWQKMDVINLHSHNRKGQHKMKKYDYLIVGAGLFGAVFAHEATKKGKTCLVIDKRAHIGGNIYTEEVEGIQVHKYGAHIFHTSKKEI